MWVVLLVIGLAAAGHAAQPSGERTWRKRAGPRFRAGEVVVKFKAGVGQQTKAAVRRRHGLAHVSTSRHAGFERASVAKGRSVAQAAAALSGEATVEYAEPNYVSQAHAVPDDPLYSFQWHLDDPANPYGGANGGGINLEAAWDAQATQGGGVVVAVVDTGVAYENYGPYVQAPDLAQTTFVPGYDFVNGDAHPNDDESHGTHVAGTIAQSTNNGVGVAGVAFDCAIMPVKVLDSTGSGWHSDIADGIAWATDNGADVINMSLGGPASLTLENAVAYAYNNGVTVVCSAGNSGRKGVEYPAAYDAYCIAVAATRYDEKYSWYSSRGPSVDVAAPGGELSDKTGRKTTDQNGDGYGDGVLQCTFNPNTGDVADFGYWFFQGTSMAAPHVSGVAALVIAAGASGPDEVRYAIESTAEDKGEAGLDDLYGYGIVDAAAAVASVTPPGPPNEPPVVAVTGPADGSAFGSGVSVSFAGTASDAEDGDISAGLVWDSDLDGHRCSGAEAVSFGGLDRHGDDRLGWDQG